VPTTVFSDPALLLLSAWFPTPTLWLPVALHWIALLPTAKLLLPFWVWVAEGLA
jgi:hypothetical protein